MDIGIDVDEPIYPWLDAQHVLCSRVLGLPESMTPPTWHPYETYGISVEEWYEILAQGALDGSLYDGEIQPGSVEQLHRLKDAGHRVHLVTTRGAFTHGHLIRAHTHAMIDKHKIPHDAITFTLDKSMVATDWSLDDLPKNVDAFFRGRRPEERGEHVLLSLPHNRETEGYFRVNSLKEFVDMVLGED